MAKTQEIQVARDAMKRWFPKGEQHCPFQNELFGMRGAGEPVKQSLQGETNQKHIVIFAGFDTALGEAGMNRGGKVFHARLSK
jgi:hypothetical protein